MVLCRVRDTTWVSRRYRAEKLHGGGVFRYNCSPIVPYPQSMRPGFTVLEMLTVLAIIGVILLIAMPRVTGWRDGLAAQRAARELALFYSRVRLGAVFRARPVRIEFADDSLRAVFEGPPDIPFLRQPGPSYHGVSLTASRPVIRLAPTGFGWGAANTKLVLRRGAAAESLTTSRLGRLKVWP